MRLPVLILAGVILVLLWRDQLAGCVPAEVHRLIGRPSAIVEPAPLHPAHRGLAECDDCSSCHTLTTAVPSGRCLACHEAIAARIESASGYHGRELAGDCVQCHDDHVDRIIDFDPESFNHRLALYPLEGKHVQVGCEECHQQEGRFRYFDLPFGRCDDCHADAHQEQLSETACSSCHRASGWKGTNLAFDHQVQSRFALDAAHRAVACSACHQEATYRPIETGCAACHRQVAGFLEGRVSVDGEVQSWRPSPHAGLVSCTDCHDTSVAHQSGSSYAARCASCHTQRYAELHLMRSAHLTSIASKLPGESMEFYLKVGSHNYVETERRVRLRLAR